MAKKCHMEDQLQKQFEENFISCQNEPLLLDSFKQYKRNRKETEEKIDEDMKGKDNWGNTLSIYQPKRAEITPTQASEKQPSSHLGEGAVQCSP